MSEQPPPAAPSVPLSAPAAGPAAASVQPPLEPSDVLLTRFFDTSAAARAAASSLSSKAEVAVRFTDVAGEFRFFADGKKPRLTPGTAHEPDFELLLGPGAVRNIAAHPDADVGALGILFFQAMLAAAPEDKVRATLHSGLFKLTTRGWLGVLAQGGPKVIGWMASKGLKGPGAVANAISKLKK